MAPKKVCGMYAREILGMIEAVLKALIDNNISPKRR